MQKTILFEELDRKMIKQLLFIDYREIIEIHTLLNSINRGILKLPLQRYATTYKVQTSLIRSRKVCSLR